MVFELLGVNEFRGGKNVTKGPQNLLSTSIRKSWKMIVSNHPRS